MSGYAHVRNGGQIRKSGRAAGPFAVGTRVTPRPPHRSVRAQFGHTACMGLSLSRVVHTILSRPCLLILLFDPRREHSSAPTAYWPSPLRAARVKDGASSAPPKACS